MPGTPTPGRMAIPAALIDMQRQLDGLTKQQTSVITDPTRATGDPSHGYATAVIGALKPITGIAAFGIAMWSGTGWFALGAPLVAALPSSPSDGQEVTYLADAANGIEWRFRYRAASSSAYKWELVGGSYMSSAVVTSQTIAFTGNWVSLSGPTITVPLKGDYAVEWGCLSYPDASGLQTVLGMGIQCQADGGSITLPASTNPGGADGRSALRRENVINDWGIMTRATPINLAASSSVNCVYFTNNNNGIFADRWLRVCPIRVG